MADIREIIIKIIRNLPQDSSYEEVLNAITKGREETSESFEPEPYARLPKSLQCTTCGRVIGEGETYSKSIIDGAVTCFRCDEGLLVKGDNLLTIE